jgi:flagellar protein FliO/FliZ
VSAVFGGGQQLFALLLVFVAVFALLALAYWLVRQFRGGQRVSAAPRHGPSRVAVVGSAPIDARRRLIVIRRDNVEHLLLIGGGADMVIEPNIVRAADAARMTPPFQETGVEALPGPPREASRRPAVRTEPDLLPEATARQPRTVPRPLANRPDWAAPEMPPQPPASRERPLDAEELAGLPAEPTGGPTPDETEESALPPSPAPPRATRGRTRQTPPFAPPDHAEMKRRLEALGRPRRGDEQRPDTEGAEPDQHETEAHAPAPQPAVPATAAAPSKATHKQASAARSERKRAKSLYESLEQEMASVHGPARRAGSPQPQLDGGDEERTNGADRRSNE